MIPWLSLIVGTYAIARLVDMIVGPDEKGKSRTVVSSVLAIGVTVFALVQIFEASDNLGRQIPDLNPPTLSIQ